jgi:CheY-like chemotaxis protein
LTIPEKILFVDDEPDLLSSFKRQFRKKAHIYTATGGQEALDLMAVEGEFAVIVSDMRMPNMSGAEFLEKATKVSPNSIRVLLTGQTDLNSAMTAINKGHIFSFLTKPCPQEVLQETLISAVRQYRLVHNEKELLEKTVKGSIELLSELLAMVKPNVFSNFNRIKKYILHMATELGESNTWDFEVAGMLYSLGYFTLPDELMEKALDPQCKLTSKEKDIVQDIPLVSSKLINHIPRLESIAEMVKLSGNLGNLAHRNNSSSMSRIHLGADLLRLALHFDKLLESGHNKASAIQMMKQDLNIYSDLIEKLATIEVDDELAGKNVRTVDPEDLLPGMILMEYLRTDSGSTLLAKGTELTEELLIRIKLYTKNQKITRPLKITTSKLSSEPEPTASD